MLMYFIGATFTITGLTLFLGEGIPRVEKVLGLVIVGVGLLFFKER